MSRLPVNACLGLASLAVLHPQGAALALDPITLNCSGTVWTLLAKQTFPTENQSLIVDLNTRSVSGSYGNFSIYTVSNSKVQFRALVEDDKGTGAWMGSVDRITGLLSIVAKRDDTYMVIHNAVCRAAKPLF